MFDGIAEHEVAERKVAERDCFCFFTIGCYGNRKDNLAKT